MNIDLSILKNQLLFIQINVDYKINTTIIEEKTIHVFIIENISSEGEMQMSNLNIDISNYPWVLIYIGQMSGQSDPR